MSCTKNAGQNHYVKITTNAIENVVMFKDFGMKLQNQNCMTEEIHPLLHYVGETPQMVRNMVLPCTIRLSTLTPSPYPRTIRLSHHEDDNSRPLGSATWPNPKR